MSPQLFALNPDLQRLRDEGYHVKIGEKLLIMQDVPYLNSKGEILKGTLISPLNMGGDNLRPPENHQVFFMGETPCNQSGQPLHLVNGAPTTHQVGKGLVAQFHFSIRPKDGQYPDYYEKMTTYAALLSAPAQAVDPSATPRVYRAPEDEEEENIFQYLETASGRVGLAGLTSLLDKERIGIVGLGGTGSYILDFVAKTPVQEIRIIDDDEFLTHNAFRAPGAASLKELREVPKKVDYLKAKYANMHRGIVAHPVRLDEQNLHLLDGLTFVFLCMDSGKAKAAIISKLEDMDIPFIDVGMGLNIGEKGLGGMLRVTMSTPDNRATAKGKVPMVSDEDNLYASNIQVVELNAMNAVAAIIKWKQHLGFYRDFEHTHHITYATDTNQWEGSN